MLNNMRAATLFRICWWSLGLLCCVVTGAAARPMESGQSLAMALQPDGSVRAGAQGCYSAVRWGMVLAADGQPAFTLAPSASITEQFGRRGPRSSPHPDGVWAVALVGRDLYVGGRFSKINGVPAHNIARWDGRAWHSLGSEPHSGLNGVVESLAVVGKTLYAMGDFDRAGETEAFFLAAWDGQRWSSLGWGEGNAHDNLFIKTMTAAGSDLYVGGEFARAGSVAAHNLARWDGRQWHALGPSIPDALSDNVHLLASWGELLYAEGDAAHNPNPNAIQAACWNRKSSTWQLLPPVELFPVDSAAHAFATDLVATDSALYMSYRAFTAHAHHNGLLRWNGRVWARLGETGPNGRGIFALAAADDAVCVAGNFKQIGGTAACNVARWSHNHWEALQADFDWDSAITGVVCALAIRGRRVYAGGMLRPFVASWNGAKWAQLPPTSRK